MSVRRGEIYWVEFSPVRGSEQDGLRPALVVQNDTGNRYSPTTIVAAITRTLPDKDYPFMVVISPDASGLPYTSAVNCAQLVTVHQAGELSRFRAPRGEEMVRPIGRLSGSQMAAVEEALRYSLGL